MAQEQNQYGTGRTGRPRPLITRPGDRSEVNNASSQQVDIGVAIMCDVHANKVYHTGSTRFHNQMVCNYYQGKYQVSKKSS